MTWAWYIVVFGCILLGIRDVKFAAKFPDAEGGITGRNVRVSERTRQLNTSEPRVVDFYLCFMEIGSIDKRTRPIAGDSKSFVNSRSRVIYCNDSFGRVDVGVPTSYGAIFSVKDEKAWTGLTVL